jgi:hypothetical protein
VQAIRTRLTDELIGNLLIRIRPAVLNLQLSESLCSRQRRLKPINATSKVVLRLIKHLLLLKDLQNRALAVESLLSVQERRQCLDVDIGLCTLLLQELSTLRACRLEVFDP